MKRPSATAFLFVTVLVDMLGYGLVVPLLPFYAGGLATGALLVGTLGSLYAAMQFFGGPFLAGLSDRTGRPPVLVVCLLGASLAYALLGLAETLALVVVAVALAGAAGGTQATAQAFVADSTPPEDRAGGSRPHRRGLWARADGRAAARRPPQPPLPLRPGPRGLRARPPERGLRPPLPSGVPARRPPLPLAAPATGPLLRNPRDAPDGGHGAPSSSPSCSSTSPLQGFLTTNPPEVRFRARLADEEIRLDVALA